LKTTFVIKVATTENMDNSVCKGSHHAPTTKLTLFSVDSKDEWRYRLVHEECMYCGMPKGTSWTEVMLNNEKIKPIALAVTGYTISQLLSRSVETPLNK